MTRLRRLRRTKGLRGLVRETVLGSGDFIYPLFVTANKKQRKEVSSMPVVFTDVCLCEYTDHGHCGLILGGEVDNDSTLDMLGRVAVSHAEAGANVVAPSGMMDGMVGAIRRALDESGASQTPILSYAVKY